MGQVEITFVVPAYNAENTIARTIESILYQTDERYKIIIVNDGSTDATEQICQRYAERYPQKIGYAYQTNRGLGGARNHGMKLVKTEYVSFLDSDDWLMPEYVEKVLLQIMNHIENPPEMIKILPRIYNENSKVVSDWYDKELFEQLFQREGQIINPQEEIKIFRTDVSQCRNVFRMEFLRRVHFQFREKVKWEDVYPHFFLLSQCHTCMGIRSVGFYYRKGSKNQITATRGKDRMDLLIVYDDLIQYVKKGVFPKDLEMELKFSIMRIMITFAMEGIRMADMDTRKELVQKLKFFFKNVHGSFYQYFIRECRNSCTKKEIVQYWLFLFVIRQQLSSRMLWDYLYKETGEKIIKKILRMNKRKI